MPAAALQVHMHQAITIVTGSRNVDCRFDENSLRAFAMLNKPVPVTGKTGNFITCTFSFELICA
jgi:hypothetical protein